MFELCALLSRKIAQNVLLYSAELGAAYTYADSPEGLTTAAGGYGAQSFVSRKAPIPFETHAAKRQIELVVNDHHVIELDFEELHRGLN